MGQFVDRETAPADLSVPVEGYFGAHPDEARNAHVFGLVPKKGENQQLYRVSYLFLLVFNSNHADKTKATEYGGMQLRAETHLWLDDGEVPVRLQKLVQEAAHRAAYLFDSSIETTRYGANDYADGYLSGFDPWENGQQYDNWEVEPVARQEVHNPPGVIDWSTEIYLDVDGLDYANLSGAATGLANPWNSRTESEPGRQPVDIPPSQWTIGWEGSRRGGDGEYYVRPQPGKAASDRYRDGAGAGKTVYINEKPIGSLDNKGRVWLSPEYGRGNPNKTSGAFGTYWSREGLVDTTAATYQAIRRGGALYQTGETEDGVYLVTARNKPENWQGVDADDVPVDLVARDGRDAREVVVFSLDESGMPMRVTCRQDREVIDHLGLSRPPYQHLVDGDFRLPDFRMVQPAHISTPQDERDDGQTGLGGYGGGQ